MRRSAVSITLAVLLLSILVLTVYSQGTPAEELSSQIRILQGGFRQGIPVDVKLVIQTETGPQTVTVPIVLNLELTVGPVDALDLTVDVDAPTQFISPLKVMEPAQMSTEITETNTISP